MPPDSKGKLGRSPNFCLVFLQCLLFRSSLSQVVLLRNQPHEGPLAVSSQHSQLHPDLPVSPDEAPDITDQKRHSHCALSDSLTHQTSECKNAVVVLYHYVAGGLFHIGKHWKHWFMFSFPSPFQKFALQLTCLNQDPSKDHTVLLLIFLLNSFTPHEFLSFFLFNFRVIYL